MTPETRRAVFRYGIAIDLVILATGVGMLFPVARTPLIVVFVAAVALSAWKGGWHAAFTALLLSIFALLGAFPEYVDASAALAFIGAAVASAAIVTAAMTSRTPRVTEPRLAHVVAFVPPPDPAVIERESLERHKTARALERSAWEQIEGVRRGVQRRRQEAAERAAREREEAERVAREREEAERAEAERVAREREEAERAEAERVAREREEAERAEAERVAREREEAERREAEQREAEQRVEPVPVVKKPKRVSRAARERAEAERVAREEAERVAREREEAERREAEERAEAERVAREREEAERREAEARAEAERVAREREEAEREAQARLEAARQAAEELAREQARVRAEREEVERRATEERERLAREREELQARMEAERRAAEEQLQREREEMRVKLEQQLAAEREAIARKAAEDTASKKRPVAPRPKPARPAAASVTGAVSNVVNSVVHTVVHGVTGAFSGWFRSEPKSRSMNLIAKKRAAARNNASATRPPVRRAAPPIRKPRLLMIERRRGSADAILAKLRQRAIEVEVVERWVDAVDELFRFRPDVLFIDTEHPEFDTMYRTVTEKSPKLPIILTGRSLAIAPPNVRHAAFVARPFDLDELDKLAHQAHAKPEELLALQSMQRTAPKLKPLPVPQPAQRVTPKPAQPLVEVVKPAAPPPVRVNASGEAYEVTCYSCRITFDAVDADWCSCLTKERTLVCTNCLTCFCKAPPAFKEKFWVEAPPRLFERKTAEARRQQNALGPNPPLELAARPLVLTVEDDPEIQMIVQRVCSNLGYGFIYATNGQDGLEMAREYRPNLILSDAFMPKLDGREMCRMLKEEPLGAECRMVIMTGLYTDTKYRSEAIKRFHVDDYIAKPVAITDLINLLQKHLEGLTGLPAPEDLHELHRQELEEQDYVSEDDVPLADVLEPMPEPQLLQAKPAQPKSDAYDVCCHNCRATFDATRAEWCSCVGRDQTLVCTHCGGCFCKAPAAYKERFWIDAPSSLFERKMIGSKRSLGARDNPMPADVKRPLILLVEDDENVQLIVRTVVTTMGYGFVAGANGQEGLTLAREYVPDLILSDAFMPKLDGREMCRLLKEDPLTSRSKAIIMTGLYTDRKYRNEALDYFKVDDYVAKPLAVDDLIKLFKKHLPQEVVAN